MTTRLFYCLFALLLISASSCELLEDAVPDVEFDVVGNEIIFKVPATTEAADITITNADIPSDVAAELDAENIDASRVKSIKLASVDFRIVTPNAPISLAAIDRASVSVASPGFPALTFAESDLTNVTTDMATLDVADVDLVERMTAATSDFSLNLQTNTVIPDSLEVGVSGVFRVVASPL